MPSANGSTDSLALKESDIQIQVADWLRLFEASCGFIFWATPNEAMGEAKTGAGLGRMARLKRMGLRSGVADIVIVKAGRAYFLELKREYGTLSKAQTTFAREAIAVEALYDVAYSFEEAQKIVKDWGIIA
jgi:hypothetical protein